MANRNQSFFKLAALFSLFLLFTGMVVAQTTSLDISESGDVTDYQAGPQSSGSFNPDDGGSFQVDSDCPGPPTCTTRWRYTGDSLTLPEDEGEISATVSYGGVWDRVPRFTLWNSSTEFDNNQVLAQVDVHPGGIGEESLTVEYDEFEDEYTLISPDDAHSFSAEETDGQVFFGAGGRTEGGEDTNLNVYNWSTDMIDVSEPEFTVREPEGSYPHSALVDGIDYDYSVQWDEGEEVTVAHRVWNPEGVTEVETFFSPEDVRIEQDYTGEFFLNQFDFDAPPGEYQFQVEVSDLTNDNFFQSENHSFTVEEPPFEAEFDLIRPEDDEEFIIEEGEDELEVEFEGTVLSDESCTGRIVLPDQEVVVAEQSVQNNTLTEVEGSVELGPGAYFWHMECESGEDLVVSGENFFTVARESFTIKFTGMLYGFLGGLADSIEASASDGGLILTALFISAVAGAAFAAAHPALGGMVFVSGLLGFGLYGWLPPFVALAILGVGIMGMLLLAGKMFGGG